METKPTADDTIVVPPAIKSCLDCRHAGFVVSLDRRCLRGSRPPEDYPTCLHERLMGGCGTGGVNFEPRFAPVTTYVPRERPPAYVPPVRSREILPPIVHEPPYKWRQNFEVPEAPAFSWFDGYNPWEIVITAVIVAVIIFLATLLFLNR